MVRKFKKIAAKNIALMLQVIKTVFMIPRGSCRFHPTCTAFAIQAIEKLPLHRSLPIVVWRLLRCNPFTAGGYDPVPEQSFLKKRK